VLEATQGRDSKLAQACGHRSQFSEILLIWEINQAKVTNNVPVIQHKKVFGLDVPVKDSVSM
jgi:hypothetical protein